MGSALSCKNDTISCSCTSDSEKIENTYNIIVTEKNRTLSELQSLYSKLDKKLEAITIQKEKMKQICAKENDILEQTIKRVSSGSDKSDDSNTEPYASPIRSESLGGGVASSPTTRTVADFSNF